MRCKVEFALDTPFLFLNPYHSFDSILAYARVLFVTKSKQTISEPLYRDIVDDLPINKLFVENDKNDDYVYLAGQAQIDNFVETQLNFTRCFSRRRHKNHFPLEQILTKWNTFDASNGPTATEMVSLKGFYSESVTYMVDVIDERKDEFELLIDLIDHIGKKASCGFGRVKNFFISYRHSYQIKRYFPIGLKEVSYDEESPILFLRIKPPYWQANGRVLCQQGTI